MTATDAPSLELYRSQHRILVDDSGPLPVCAVDRIRCGPGLRPSHNASPRCASGGRAHCSCPVCF